MKYFLLLLSLFSLSSYAIDFKENDRVYFDHLFWHENSRYTFMSIDNNTKKVNKFTTTRDFDFGDDNDRHPEIELYIDLEANDKPWVSCSGKSIGFSMHLFCEIHIHSIDDMRTAGLNHGKFGTGSTFRFHR